MKKERYELKPCQFCGAGAHLFKNYGDSYTVMCGRKYISRKEPHCGASIMMPTREKAVKAWNRRENKNE